MTDRPDSSLAPVQTEAPPLDRTELDPEPEPVDLERAEPVATTGEPEPGSSPVGRALGRVAAPAAKIVERVVRRIARRPSRWAMRPWTPQRVTRTAVTFLTLAVTTSVMMRVVHFNPLAWAGIGPDDLVFDDTTPAGGDLGAHVWAPAYLRDVLLPNWQLSGWSMDWYEGLPVYRFYMVVPALAIVALDTVLPYGVAIKVVAMAGLVTLPVCCWAFGRLARFHPPIPELFAFAALCFLLNESYRILGGNVLSTMAGEFSFSIAVSLMMVGLGLLCRALRDGRGYVAAAAVLALACLSHGIVLIYTAITACVIVACRLGVDLWRALRRAAARPRDESTAGWLSIDRVTTGVLLAPAFAVLTVVLGRRASAFYGLTVLVAVAVIVGVAVICRELLRSPRSADRVAARRFVSRGARAVLTGALTFGFSAFWVGPFLFNHEYMTDMKYRQEPAIVYSSWWEMYFDQEPALDMLITGLAVVGIVASIARRHLAGTALAVTAAIAAAMVYAARESLPGLGLLWNPRVLPFLYLTRFLLMAIGAAELLAWIGNLFRRRAAHAAPGAGSMAVTTVVCGLVVLVSVGWLYRALPGGTTVERDDGRAYAWGPFESPRAGSRALGDAWTRYNFNGYERRPTWDEYSALMLTMGEIGEELGCGRALWERDQRDSVGNVRYGSTMALMLLPFWTDGCIGSSEGLFFEASATTPYHFLAAHAMSQQASGATRQQRYTVNDAEVGVPYLQQLGISYLMVTRPDAISAADAHPDLALIGESGPWRIYSVADAEVVTPLDVQPVVVNGRPGDQRECWLELGTSWFQQPAEWVALPAADGPAEWQRIDVEIDPDRQVPPGQGVDRCGEPYSDPARRVNIVAPATEIEPVALPVVEVSNVDIGDQSVSFAVDEVGVPVLVKVSYFPNWRVDGADGPYRVAPNFMVVVPTDHRVELSFGRTASDIGFSGLTLISIVGCGAWWVRGRWRRRQGDQQR